MSSLDYDEVKGVGSGYRELAWVAGIAGVSPCQFGGGRLCTRVLGAECIGIERLAASELGDRGVEFSLHSKRHAKLEQIISHAASRNHGLPMAARA